MARNGDWKMSARMLGGFVVISVAGAVIGTIGTSSLEKAEASQKQSYEHMTVPIGQLVGISTKFQMERVAIRDAILAANPADRARYAATARQMGSEIDASSTEFEKTILYQNMRDAYREFREARSAYEPLRERILNLAETNHDAEAIQTLRGGLATARRVDTSLSAMTALKIEAAKDNAAASSASTSKSIALMRLLLIATGVVAVGLGVLLARSVGYEIRKVQSRVELIERIAGGDLSQDVAILGSDDVLGRSLKQMVETLRALIDEAGELRGAAVAGQLDTRGHAERFAGAYRDIIQGVNDTLDALVGPLKVASQYVDRLSRGDIPAPITETYSGDFNVIKDNLNACIAEISSLTDETGKLIDAARAGRLNHRADAGRAHGEYARILSGLNETLDALINPLQVTADYVDRISRGDIPEKIAQQYNGDFNAIKDNLNTCIDAVQGLVTDAQMLADAGVAGRLSTRADASRHRGQFRAVVDGVNATLDAIVTPLSNAGAVVDRMAVNDYTTRVEGTYRGDFEAFVNNVNGLADRLTAVQETIERIAHGDTAGRNGDTAASQLSANDRLTPSLALMTSTVQGLVAETTTLVQATAHGDLSRRGDANRYEGAYRSILEGINGTLDGVSAPIQEAAEVLQRVANRDLAARMDGTYEGDFAAIKDALNKAVENLDESLLQVSQGADQVANAAVEISSGSQTLSQGASEQAASLEEISSSLQEVASMTRQNAGNAKEARGLAEAAQASAARGSDAMQRMSEAVDRIKTSSDQTAKIVKTIDEIAFQTNLLALNAAVEAARAGDAGKGFAVVAEEVRNLAMRSAEAAKNTASMIEESVKNAEGGVVINQEVLAKLTEIDHQVNRVAEVMTEIAAASEQQTQGIDQVTTAIAEMDSLTQANAANSEESASAAEELSSQAEQMRSMVAGFQLTAERSARNAKASRPRRTMAHAGAQRPMQRDPRLVIPFDDQPTVGLADF